MSRVENNFNFTLLMVFNDWNQVEKFTFDEILDQLEYFFTFTNVHSGQVTSISNSSNQLIYKKDSLFTRSRDNQRSKPITFTEHGPNPIIWKGNITLSNGQSPLQELKSFIRDVCTFTHHHRTNKIKLSFGVIWQFCDDQSTGFNQLVDVDCDLSRKRHFSSLDIGDFSLGNFINGQKFIFHFRSDKIPLNSSASSFLSTTSTITIDKLSFQIFHREKICQLEFRINKVAMDNQDWTTKWIKFTYNSQLINVLIINSYQDPVAIYLCLPGSPKIYEKQNTFSSDGDFNLIDESETNQWIRCTDCYPITREIISKCQILRLSLNKVQSITSIQKKHQSLHETIYSWRQFGPLQVIYSSTPRFFVHPLDKDSNINNPPKFSFEIDYALQCIRSISYEFKDDFLNNHGGEKKLNEFIRDQIEAGKKEQLLEALYRLFYAYTTGKVYDAFLHLKWLMGRVDREYEFILKRQNTNRVKFLRQAVLTPTRTLFLPPSPFRSTSYLENADTESIMRVTLKDDDFCLQNFISAFAETIFHSCDEDTINTPSDTEKNLDSFVKECVENRLTKDGGLVVSGRVYKYLEISSNKFGDDCMIFHSLDSY